jgi:hypothetical protein
MELGEPPLVVHQLYAQPPLRSAPPPEIRDELVRKICRDLGIDAPDHT